LLAERLEKSPEERSTLLTVHGDTFLSIFERMYIHLAFTTIGIHNKLLVLFLDISRNTSLGLNSFKVDKYDDPLEHDTNTPSGTFS